MDVRKITGAILIIISLVVGYIGFNKISQSSNEVKVLGVEIEASDESGKKEGYLYVGLAIVLFGGGIFTINRTR